MEKIMIPPLDSNAAEVIKNNWAKMDKPLHSLGTVSYTHLTLPTT